MNILQKIISRQAIFFVIFFAIIILFNIHPGMVAIGNDNFSPELDPGLTLKRSIFEPGWRTYRVLGIPSDSEQADIFRSFIYFILDKLFIPVWIISQGYFFFTLFIGIYSAGQLTYCFVQYYKSNKLVITLFGALFYFASLITLWIYFFPVHLFVAAYAFLPFVLWRLAQYSKERSRKNALLLVIASLLLSTSALTATMFITSFGVIIATTMAIALKDHNYLKGALIGLGIVFISQLYWILPFATYVYSNTSALRESLINRKITSLQVENELKYNTAVNTLRYYFSWVDTKENGTDYTHPYRNLYASIFGQTVALIPLLFALIGGYFIIRKRLWYGMVFMAMYLGGWLLIKGQNSPFGFLYGYIQENYPVFSQVFRWQSSKFWPFMAVSLPILATQGINTLCHIFHSSFKKYVLVVPAVILLIYMFPVFNGHLIRDSLLVSIPNEYYSLKAYLEENDPNSRIYLAPEANTLYFRNYSWGFWGSVFLNYLLPNPIVEKALVIGSSENEDAFTQMKNAYYSADTEKFAQVLQEYGVKYVLSDEFVDKGETGYRYDWENHRKMVMQNPYFENVWEDGNIGLYKVKKDLLKRDNLLTPVASIQQQKLLGYIMPTMNTYEVKGTDTTLYPMALDYDSYSVNTSSKRIIANYEFKGPSRTYTQNITAEMLLQSPTTLTISSGGYLILEPAFPYVGVSGDTNYQSIQERYSVNDKQYNFISLNEQVYSAKPGLVGHNRTSFLDASNSSSLLTWGNAGIQVDLLDRKNSFVIWCNNSPTNTNLQITSAKTICGTSEIQVDTDSVAELSFKVRSTNEPVAMNICFESRIFQKCINNNPQTFVDGLFESNYIIPQLVYGGDKVKVYVNLATYGDKKDIVSIEKLLLNLYQENEVPQKIIASNGAGFTRDIQINNGDNITMSIPIIEGESSFNYDPQNTFTPEISMSFYNTSGNGAVTMHEDKSLVLEHTEGDASIFTKPLLFQGNGIGMIFMNGENINGIPAEIRVKNTKQEYFFWEEKLFPRKPTSMIRFVYFPSELKNYVIEFFSSAIGERPSINVFSNVTVQVIPESWYKLALTPAKTESQLSEQELTDSLSIPANSYTGIVGENKLVVSIPTAYSPYWIIKNVNKEAGNIFEVYAEFIFGKTLQVKPTVVNGWKQAWIIEGEKGSRVMVIFWPNILAYLGYGVIVLLGIILIPWKHLLQKIGKKTSHENTL